MSTDNAAVIRKGFEAFLNGDFDALRELMEPDAQWLYWEPIPGDCHGRDKIIATLRERHAEGVVGGSRMSWRVARSCWWRSPARAWRSGGCQTAGRRWWSPCVTGGSCGCRRLRTITAGEPMLAPAARRRRWAGRLPRAPFRVRRSRRCASPAVLDREDVVDPVGERVVFDG